MRRAITCGAALAALLAAAGSARADIFKLGGGGEIRGELANPAESPRQYYLIKPYAGGQVKLAAALVTEVVAQRPIEVDYERQRLEQVDTVDGQWTLAEWCRRNKLAAQRKSHLERILELDPDHAEARRVLGYEKVGQRWLTQAERMQEQGRVKFRGTWRLTQEVEQIKEREKNDQVQREWFAQLSKWRSWLDSDKAAAARENILGIKDKTADKALISRLKEEKDYTIRGLFAQSLANLGTPDAVRTLVQLSLEDRRDSFRVTCLELIEKTKPPAAVAMYIKALGSKDNVLVNRAAAGLARLEDKSAVPALIEALVTKHRYLVGSSNPGQISPTFSRDSAGNGGIGLGLGGSGPKVVTRQVRNDEVLRALVKLTGEDFDFNVDGWKYWLASAKKKAPRVNARRD